MLNEKEENMFLVMLYIDGKIELATQEEFDSFDLAEKYLNTVNQSYSPFIVKKIKGKKNGSK